MDAINLAHALSDLDARRAEIATWIVDSLVTSGRVSSEDLGEYAALYQAHEECQRKLAEIMLRAARDRRAARA